MGAGVEAVESIIAREFGPRPINRIPTEDDGTVLSFQAEGRNFTVVVTVEFDSDYPSGTTADIDDLGTQLRGAASGRVVVRTTGIAQG